MASKTEIMKKSRIYVTILAAVLLTGCTDWLMVQPRGVEVPDKLEHYEGLLYGTDQVFIGEVFPYMCFENTCTGSGYETMYSAVGRPECNAYLWQADIFREDEECAEWNFPAAGMYALNVVVNGVMDASDGTDEEKLAVRSEARMMRAYMHFLMAQFFGKPYDTATAGQDLCIPLITEASTTQTDLPRRTVEDVYDFILTEMTESVANLPDRMSHHKRVFRTAGYTMLGKVYWMMGRYEDALPAFEEAMKSLRSSETDGIFLDYPALAGDGGAISYPTDPKLNPEELYELESMFLLYHSMWPSYYGSTLIYIKPEVLQEYYADTEDYRLSFMAAFSTGASPYGKAIDLSDQYYIDLQHTRITTNFGITTPDLFLMYAECLARTGNDDEAVALLEELRAARMPAANAAVPASLSGNELVKYAVAERMRENLGYGASWFDMRRLWNDPLFQDMKKWYVHTDGVQEYTLTEQRLVMRIPPSVMIWHDDYVNNE